MKFVPVQSSNIAAVGYAPERRELGIEFKSGTRYHYEGVPPEKHSGLMSAPSHGKYFLEEIKPHHPSRKAGGTETLGGTIAANGAKEFAAAAARWSRGSAE